MAREEIWKREGMGKWPRVGPVPCRVFSDPSCVLSASGAFNVVIGCLSIWFPCGP